MPISRLSSPCTVPSWEGDDRSDAQACQGPHYRDGDKLPGWDDGKHASFHKGCGGIVTFGFSAFCLSCEDEGLGDGDWEARVVVPRALTYCCVAATCDGECGEDYGDEDSGSRLHCASPLVLEWDLHRAGWAVKRDGRVYCPADAPWSSGQEVPAVIEGQDTLGFGEEAG